MPPMRHHELHRPFRFDASMMARSVDVLLVAPPTSWSALAVVAEGGDPRAATIVAAAIGELIETRVG